MEYKEKLELAASDYAITHYEQGKAYASLEVHKMLVDAFSAGANGLKYNEALDRAKEELTKDNTYETNQAIERIFPELKSESEEEKIIDTLIWLVEGRKKNRTAAYGDVKIDDILAWLKKRKEE